MQSYFDVNAHQPPLPEITRSMCELLRDGQLGNPSSTHARGRAMRYLIEQARNEMNQFFGGGWQVIFTSGATEANNLWFRQMPHGAKLMVSAVEHPSVMMPAKQWSQWGDAQATASKSAQDENQRCALSIIKVSPAGEIDFEQLEDSCARAKGQIYVSVQAANSETGIVQDLQKIADLVKKYQGIFHCDAVQLLGKYIYDWQNCPADALTLSAHKIGGLLGAGALLVKQTALQKMPLKRLKPQILGGAQQAGIRAGTENYLAIASFQKALSLIDDDKIKKMQAFRQKLQAGLEQAGAEIIGKISAKSRTDNQPDTYPDNRLANTVFALHPTLQAQQILMQLDLVGISASSGSACASGTEGANQTLLAMGYHQTQAQSAVRFSFGADMDEAGIDYLISCFQGLKQ